VEEMREIEWTFGMCIYCLVDNNALGQFNNQICI
jgi:hypothetical protein